MTSSGEQRPPDPPDDTEGHEQADGDAESVGGEPPSDGPEEQGVTPEEPGERSGEPEAEPPEGVHEPEADPPKEDHQPAGAPDYNVYRTGSDEPIGKQPAKEPPPGVPPGGAGDRPDYKIYRSRPRLSDRFRKPGELEGLTSAAEGAGLRDRLSRFGDRFRGGGGRGKRRWALYLLIGAVTWILISFVAFALSAQIQKGKLSDRAKAALEGGSGVLAGQNILILGGDQRGKVGANEPGGGGPPRADTIMVVHASLTSFRKLSIPRDTQAAIPGCGTQKINAAFSCNGGRRGNAALAVQTVGDFLGIDIDHLVIIDFDGFVDFIDAIGGVKVTLPSKVCGTIAGGKKNGGQGLKLSKGTHELRALQALTLARIRKNTCDPSEDDRDRAARQQLILNGIKSRLTSPTRFPVNFIKGPFIGWAAPKAFISDLGGVELPQVAIAAIFGGSGKPNVLRPTGSVAGGLFIPGSECERAVRELTGGAPNRNPQCSPG